MSILVAVLIVLLLAAVVAVVSGPLRSAAGARIGQPDDTGVQGRAAAAGQREREALDAELAAAREAKYQEIRDAELDYRTGKLSREDFEAVDATLRAEAIAILNRIAELGGER
jgi:hypothetical protein